MAGLDDRAHQAGDTDAVAAHMRVDLAAFPGLDRKTHRGAVFGAEGEDVADLDAAAGAEAIGGHRTFGNLGVLLLFHRVEIGKASDGRGVGGEQLVRSEEHTSELQSLMRTSYAVF